MHRFRHRPYDLRRRVLLKNFLKDQMTSFPLRKDASEKTEEKEAEENSKNDTNSLGNEENIQNSCVNNNSENKMPITDETIASTTSDEETIDVETRDSEVPKELTKSITPFSYVSSLFRREHKRGAIVKAKCKVKRLKSPIKVSALASNMKMGVESSKKPKSLFSLFKSRKDKRKNQPITEAYPYTVSTPTKSTTTQSCQTDISFTDTTNTEKLLRDNQVLQESNRQLTESLSLLIKNNNFQSSSPSICTDAYCGDSFTQSPPPDLLSGITSTEPVLKSPQPQSSRILRSDTEQEKSRNKMCTRSKSLSYPGTSLLSRNHCLSAKNPLAHTSASNQPRSPVLKNLSINSNRGVIRRSSMPERAGGPLLRRRSNNSHDRVPYPLRSNNSLGSSDVVIVPRFHYVRRKPVVRRSSMPDRGTIEDHNYHQHRPVHRRNTMSWTNESHNATRAEVRHSVRFRDMPSEAFY